MGEWGDRWEGMGVGRQMWGASTGKNILRQAEEWPVWGTGMGEDRYGRGQVWAGQGEKLGEQVGGQGWEWAGEEREWGRSKLPLAFGVPLYT